MAEERTGNEENIPTIKIMSEKDFLQQMEETPNWVSNSVFWSDQIKIEI